MTRLGQPRPTTKDCRLLSGHEHISIVWLFAQSLSRHKLFLKAHASLGGRPLGSID